MILEIHRKSHEEILRLPQVVGQPFILIGHQLTDWDVPRNKMYPFAKYLRNEMGLVDVYSLDYCDQRADILWDMNQPITKVPEMLKIKAATVYDIGTLEHIHNASQAILNSIMLLERGGHYVLHTPVRGYHDHGYHTFHPEWIVDFLQSNRMHIVHLKYTNKAGSPLYDLSAGDVLLWLVARKQADLLRTVYPIQKKYRK